MKKTTSILTGCLLASLSAQAQRPNIVLILADDQNKNTVGCYDSSVSTPNLEYLAAHGMKFTNANVVTTVSSPSRYSILTGRYYSSNYSPEFLADYPAGTVACMGNDCYLESDGNNLAGNLRKAGYSTGFVGKFHLTGHPYLQNNRNWAEAGLESYSKNSDPRTDAATDAKMKHNHQWWCDQIKKFGFDYVNGVYAANLRELFNDYTNAHNVEWTMDSALKFLDAQKGSQKPFMLYMATTYPHGPAPQMRKEGKYIHSLDADPSITGEGVRPDLKGEFPSRVDIVSRYEQLKAADPSVSDTAVTALWWDAVVGKIIDKLREMGVEDNTIIVYLSDHGVLNGGKSTLYDDGTCVPLIIRWQQGIPQGVTYDHVVGSIDLAPTLMELAGVNMSATKTDGVSLAPAFHDPSHPVRDALLLEMGYARAIKTDNCKYIAIRYPENPQTKTDPKSGKPYIMLHGQLASRSAAARPYYFEPDQLYDFRRDPRESENLYGQDSLRDSRLRILMQRETNRYAARPFGEFKR